MDPKTSLFSSPTSSLFAKPTQSLGTPFFGALPTPPSEATASFLTTPAPATSLFGGAGGTSSIFSFGKPAEGGSSLFATPKASESTTTTGDVKKGELFPRQIATVKQEVKDSKEQNKEPAKSGMFAGMFNKSQPPSTESQGKSPLFGNTPLFGAPSGSTPLFGTPASGATPLFGGTPTGSSLFPNIAKTNEKEQPKIPLFSFSQTKAPESKPENTDAMKAKTDTVPEKTPGTSFLFNNNPASTSATPEKKIDLFPKTATTAQSSLFNNDKKETPKVTFDWSKKVEPDVPKTTPSLVDIAPPSLFGQKSNLITSDQQKTPKTSLFGDNLQFTLKKTDTPRKPSITLDPQSFSVLTPKQLPKQKPQGQSVRRPSIDLKPTQKITGPSLLDTVYVSKPIIDKDKDVQAPKAPKPSVTFAESEANQKTDKKEDDIKTPPKPPALEKSNSNFQVPKTSILKASDRITQVQPVELVSQKVAQQQFFSCKEILNTVSQKRHNKEQLKQFLSLKSVQNVLSFSEQSTFTLNGQNFRISSKAMPHYDQTHINLKRFIFDLIGCYKSINKYSDWRCLNVFQNFFFQVHYYNEFRTQSFNPKDSYFQSKSVYELGQNNTIRINYFSHEIKKIMQMLIDQQLIMTSLICRSMLLIQQSLTKGQFNKIFNKNQLITQYFKYYFKLITKIDEEDEQLAKYYRAKLRLKTNIVSKFLVYFVEAAQVSDIVSEQLLVDIIKNFDEYIDKDDVVQNIASEESQIVKSHQRIITTLLQLHKAKRNQNNVINKYPKVEVALKNTNSNTLLPFREIIGFIKKSEERSTQQLKKYDFKRVLQSVDSPEWSDWIEIYLQQSTFSTTEYEAIVTVLEKVYTTTDTLNDLFKTNDNGEKIHPLFKHIEVIKKNRNHFLLYRIYKILLGNEEINNSDEVIFKHIKDKEWTEYILKPLLERFKQSLHNQAIFTEATKDTDIKALFLFRLIQLNPHNIKSYSEKIFRNQGNSLQFITFLLDCFNLYTLNGTRNYKIASEIVKCFNKLLLEEKTYKDTLHIIGLYHSMNSDNNEIHWLLRFIPQLNRDVSPNSKLLKNELHNHLQILLSHRDILLLAPEKQTHSLSYFKEKFRQRYSFKNIWSHLDMNNIPGSPWVRSVALILNDTKINYRVIGNIVKHLSFKSCQFYTNQVPYLNLIKDILNNIPVVERLIEDLEQFSSESLSVLNSKKQMYDTLKTDNKQKMETIQDGLFLFHSIIDLLHASRKLFSNQKYSNYYMNVINNLKCLYDIQGVLGGYISNISEERLTHPIVNLFGFINYQGQRLLPLSNNPTLSKQKYKTYIFPNQLKNTSINSQLDYNYLLNPLSSPANKQYSAVESISINILKVLTVIIKSQANMNLSEFFKRQIGSGVFQLILNLIQQSSQNFEANKQQCIVALEFLNAAISLQPKFVWPMFISTSSSSFFSFLDYYLKSDINDIEILQKVMKIVLSLDKIEQRKTTNLKNKQKDYKQLFLNKLQLLNLKNTYRLETIQSHQNISEILERIVAERNILEFGRYLDSIQILFEMTTISIFRGQKPDELLRNLISFALKNRLISTVNSWRLPYNNEMNRVSDNAVVHVAFSLEAYFEQSVPFIHMGNYRNDVIETHTLNTIYEEQSIFKHIPAYSNNIYSFMKDVATNCSQSIYNLLIFILNCGEQGYFLSTQPLNIKQTDLASSLYCQFHQPKLSFALKNIYIDNNQLKSIMNSIVDILLGDIHRVTPKCNYRLCLQLLSSYLHMTRSFSIDFGVKRTIQSLLDNPSWINQNEPQIDILVTNPLVATIIMEILSLVKENKISSASLNLKNLASIVSRSLGQTNLVPETKTSLLMSLLVLIKMNVEVIFDSLQLLAQYNSTYFYSISRILVEHAKKNSLDLVEGGILMGLCNHSILSTINQTFVFYNNGVRQESQMSWIWTLNLLYNIVFYGGQNATLIMTETIGFLNHFNNRVFAVLDAPNQRNFIVNYAYLEELEALLKLLNITFRVFKNIPMSAKSYLQRVQYSLFHNTIRIFDLISTPFAIISSTISEKKLENINLFNQTFKKNTKSPSVFTTTIQSMITNSLLHFAGVLEISISTSLFIKLYFQKPIENSNIIYSNYFWLFTNKNIHQIEQHFQSFYKTVNDWPKNVLDNNRLAWMSPELFSSNGYLPALKEYQTQSDLIHLLFESSLMLSRMSLVYHRQQIMYRQKYLSLVPEDIEDFRSQQVKFIKTIENLSSRRGKEGLKALEELKDQFTNLMTNDIIMI